MMAVSRIFASGSEMVLPILDLSNCACLYEAQAKPGLLTSFPERMGGSQISLAQGVMHNFSGRSKSSGACLPARCTGGDSSGPVLS